MGARAEISFEVGLVGGAVDSVEDFGWGYFIPNNQQKHESSLLLHTPSTPFPLLFTSKRLGVHLVLVQGVVAF